MIVVVHGAQLCIASAYSAYNFTIDKPAYHVYASPALGDYTVQ